MAAHYPDLVAKRLLNGVGHGAPEESPDAVSAELIGFLNALTGRGGSGGSPVAKDQTSGALHG